MSRRSVSRALVQARPTAAESRAKEVRRAVEVVVMLISPCPKELSSELSNVPLGTSRGTTSVSPAR